MPDVHIAQIWQYPVKSFIGHTVPTATLDATGIVGDRQWALRDVASGNLANCRQTPGIMRLAAAAVIDGVEITLPEGGLVRSSADDVDTVLSAALGTDVRLESLRPADDLDYYRRSPTEMPDPMAHLRGIFGRDDDEPLPDFAKFGPAVLEYDSPPGTFYDYYPLMVMSTSALRAMSEAVPDSVIDVRRFRPDPVPEKLIDDLIELATHAPSVGFSQPWRFVKVRSPERRRAVWESFAEANARALGGYEGAQKANYMGLKLAGLKEAPIHLAVFCDESTATGSGLGRQTMPETLRYSVVAAIQTMWLAARAEGLVVSCAP